MLHLVGDSLQVSSAQDVVHQVLVDPSIHFFVVESVHFEGEKLPLLNVDDCVAPRDKHDLHATSSQVLPGPFQHISFVFLVLQTSLQRVECSAAQVAHISLLTDLAHVDLHPTIVNSLS